MSVGLPELGPAAGQSAQGRPHCPQQWRRIVLAMRSSSRDSQVPLRLPKSFEWSLMRVSRPLSVLAGTAAVVLASLAVAAPASAATIAAGQKITVVDLITAEVGPTGS